MNTKKLTAKDFITVKNNPVARQRQCGGHIAAVRTVAVCAYGGRHIGQYQRTKLKLPYRFASH